MPRNIFQISKLAASRISQLQPKRSSALYVSVKTWGCHGLSWDLDFIDNFSKLPKGYEKVEQNGVTLVVDPKALMYVIGTEIQLEENELNSKFVFKNPNAKRSCGCGSSFSVE